MTAALVRREVLAPDAGPGLDPFTRSLLLGEGPARNHLPALPLDPAGLARLASETRAKVAPPPGPLVEALVAYQRCFGLGPRAEANAKALGGGALAVVTGQQPGLLGGALLSLHKAAGVIAFARSMEESGGGQVVPVFWVASEDHDWAESNRATVIDAGGALHSLSLGLSGDGRSVRDVPISDEAVRAALRDLAACLPATDRAASAVSLATPNSPTDLGSWFVECLARLFGDAGLVVVEPHVLAPWAGPAYARLVRHADAIGAAVRAEGERLRADGLPAPLDPRADSAPLFLRDAPRGRRLRVSFDRDRVRLRDEPSTLDRAALEKKVLADPSLASGDVAGRVFVQNELLPVFAYVGGPTELAYLAQIRAAHEAVGARFPLAVPRPQATWVEPKVARTLRAFGMTEADALRGSPPPPSTPANADKAVTSLEAVRAELASAADRLRDVPGVSKALREGIEGIDRAMKGLVEEREEKSGRGRARWEKAQASLKPRGEPQERVLSPVSLVARYGLDALREGLSLLDPLAPGHQLLHLD